MDKETVDNFLDGANYRRLKKRRTKIKEELVKYKGGKCERCGYDKCINALEFHHLDPSEKEFSISKYSVLSIEKLKKEVDKCVLVCANCHREIHFEIEEEKRKEAEEIEKNIYAEILSNRDVYGNIQISKSYKYLESAGILSDMEQNMDRKDIFSKYHINNRTFNKFLKENNLKYSKTNRPEITPTKEELIELLKNKSKSDIGKIYGVTCSAVIKWCKKYKLFNKKLK